MTSDFPTLWMVVTMERELRLRRVERRHALDGSAGRTRAAERRTKRGVAPRTSVPPRVQVRALITAMRLRKRGHIA